MKYIINCEKFKKETKDLMFSLIDDSDDKNKEHYIKLCEDVNGDITSSNVCIGSECAIPLKEIAKTKCPVNTKAIGDFHTHPWFNGIENEPFGGIIPTVQDIIATASEGYSSFCHGHSDIKSIKIDKEWVERKTNIINCYDIKDKELLDLGNEAQRLAQEGKIRQAKKKIIPLMFKRAEKLGRSSILHTKCKLTKISEQKEI